MLDRVYACETYNHNELQVLTRVYESAAERLGYPRQDPERGLTLARLIFRMTRYVGVEEHKLVDQVVQMLVEEARGTRSEKHLKK